MKNVLKLFIAVLGISFTSSLYAQTFGIKGGLNSAKIILKENEEDLSEDFDPLLGFHAGLTAEFPINNLFSFQTGALLSTKGMKFEELNSVVDITSKMNLLYLDIPLHLKANFGSSEGLNIYALAGPYVGIGLVGKIKTEGKFMDEEYSNVDDIKFGSNEEDDLKRLDYGVSVGAGIELKKITIGATYNLGLANLATDTNNGEKVNHRVFQISLGYKF